MLKLDNKGIVLQKLFQVFIVTFVLFEYLFVHRLDSIPSETF